jgi:5-methyltetrahydrofolate--homocysteine methyltransferase
VRIAPAYSQPTLYVRDASRVVGVVSDLLDPVRCAALDQENRADQDRLRDLHAERVRKPLLPYARALENRNRVAFDDVPEPAFLGTGVVEPDLETLRGYIDWQFFFHAWDLKGKFPAILERPEARELYDDALELLDELVRERLLQARGVHGFWPASSDAEDVVVDGGTSFAMLRQQVDHGDSRPNRSLADYVAPAGAGDHVGAFTVGVFGADELAARFEAERDDYRAILTKALADRLAEAFAEYLHEESRRSWYEQGPRRSKDELVAERYRGIRPAFGYPACPDHSEKAKLFALLSAEAHGFVLTETFAVSPAAAVSGIYLHHPEARYFSVGRIGRDQVKAYAARQGRSLAEAERWVRPNLAYEPEERADTPREEGVLPAAAK